MNYKDSATITQLLFSTDIVNKAGKLANAVLFSNEEPREKFKILLGCGGFFEDAEGKFPQLNEALTYQDNPILISHVVAACVIAHPSDTGTLCDIIAHAQSEMITPVLRQGLILGLTTGGALLGSAKVPNYEQDLHFLDRILKLAWFGDEDSEFLNGAKGELSNQVAKFIKGAGEVRKVALAKFLDDAAFHLNRERVYPSLGAEQVVLEFTHKIVGSMNDVQSLLTVAKGLRSSMPIPEPQVP